MACAEISVTILGLGFSTIIGLVIAAGALLFLLLILCCCNYCSLRDVENRSKNL